MKKNFGIILSIALGLSALLLTIAFQAGWVNARSPLQETREGAPDFISYQGQIWDDGKPYDGEGYFMFAIVNEGEDYIWSNDGLFPPKASINLAVANGLFSVNIGDTNVPGMDNRLSADAFEDPLSFLRVWFSPDDVNWTQMPDQQIAAVPYAYNAQLAMYADQATNADTLDTKHATAFQLRVTGVCPAGQSIREIYSGGNVLCEVDDSNTYTNGSGLLLVGNTFSADPDYLQRRVSTSCVEGSAIKTINSDGSVICESIPDAATFSLSTIAATGTWGVPNSMAIGTDGLGLISYIDRSSHWLKVAHCADTNCSSATSYNLAYVGGTGIIPGDFTSLTIGTDGFGLISYLNSDYWDLKVAHCNNTACSTATITTLDSAGEVGFFSSIVIGADGLGLISYYDDTHQELKVAHCNDTTCTGAISNILDSTGTVGYYTDIAIGTDGFGLISYQDAGNTNLKVAHCSNAACSSATVSTLDSTDNVGYDTSITIGRDGFGLICYADSTNYKLKVAHCDNTTCTSANKVSLNSGDVTGSSSSITIGIDGYGVISYWDDDIGALKIAHCVNDICFGATFYTLDTTYGAAASTSIVIGEDGYPLISYDGGEYNDLKVAHCSNELCIPINWEH